MRLPNRIPVLFVVLLAVLLSVPVIAGDGASVPVQASAAEGQAADCARVSPDVAVPFVPELAPELLSVWSTGPELTPVEPIAQQGPPFRRGYCKCGCGITCETDADCGPGGSCVGFITCC